ncbi:MAG: DUF2924 domain-containing protein [Rhodobacteraceae bacterium]|nr:DUF2924 domain-containing protein [Paracoccaceae bacterium]
MSPRPTVAEIEVMPREALVGLWPALMGGPVPRGMSLPMLRRFLAVEVQAQAVPGAVVKALTRRLAAAGQERVKTPALRPGGRLLREWNGVTHVVDVTPEGYRWQGATHRSLSAIARAITGAHWSGPRFFGLAGTPQRRAS